jgi:hypothetical protein
MYTKDQMTRIGGREWTHPRTGEVRIYINDDIWAPLVDFEVNRYKSGNICGASLNGRRVSNNKASYVLVSRIYWTSTTGELRFENSSMLDDVIGIDTVEDAIRKAVEDSEPASDDSDSGQAGATGIVEGLRQAGRTVREIAEMVGVSVSSVYRWARGICQPRPANLAALAAI